MTYEEIREQAATALEELLEKSHLQKGDIFIIGCSSSEIKGANIGRGSDLDAAKAVYEGVAPILKERGIFLAAQCCEHLNRAVILERAALLPGQEIVNVVPQLHAGGSFAMTVYNNAEDPVAVEEVRRGIQSKIDNVREMNRQLEAFINEMKEKLEKGEKL